MSQQVDSDTDIFDENNFYKLLGVTSQATQEEIRAAYQRREREFDPENNTVDTRRIFDAVKLAYRILGDEAERLEYDEDFDDDQDDDIFTMMKERQGHGDHDLTEAYKKEIEHSMIEYENLSFSNNFQEKLQEIINKAIPSSEHTPAVDNYVQCCVCHQCCTDFQAHERENCQPYENLFTTVTPILSLEQVISPEIWNWKAVERTSVHLPIWNAQEKWKQVSSYISQFTVPFQIVSKSERYWTVLLDAYEQNHAELTKSANTLAKTTTVNYLPDADETRLLKEIFDKYDQEKQRNVLSKLQKNDERTESGNYYLFDPKTTNKYIDKHAFCFPITAPPPEIYREQCSACQKSFTLFLRHHHCRMCGQQFCANCLTFKRIPHLGFITKPVRICRQCCIEKEHLLYEHIATYVKQLITGNQLEHLSIYLVLLHQYKADGNEQFFRETGEEYYRAQNYLLALQCFTYARLDGDEWLRFSVELCKKSEYSYSLTCMKLCEKADAFWLEQARSQHDSNYALLCYEHLKLSVEQLFKLTMEKLPEHANTCLLYLIYINIKHAGQVNWKELGNEALLKPSSDGSLAILCFHLYGKMSKDAWNDIAEQLCQANQFERLGYLLAHLYHIQQIDFRTSKNSCIYFLTKILVTKDGTISIEDWLNEICDPSAVEVNRIIIGLSTAHLYKHTSWVEYKTEYIKRKEYYKVLLCHQMAENLIGNTDTQWLIKAIEDLDPIGYELFNGTNRPSRWRELADQYFQNEQFLIALNCYLFCEQNQVDQILIQQAQAPTLPLSTALLYYTVVYRHTRRDHSKILSKNNESRCSEAFHSICIVLSKQNNPNVVELLQSAIRMYEPDDRLKSTELFPYHVLLLNELAKSNDHEGKNDRPINGGVHILFTFAHLSEETVHHLTSLNQSFLSQTNEKVFNDLKSRLFKSGAEFIGALLEPTNYFLAPLKQLFQQCLGRMVLSEVKPAHYRAKLYLLEAMMLKLENNPVQSLSSAHNALLADSDNLQMFSMITFINHSQMHFKARQSLINDIRENSLNLADISPPTQMKKLHVLERTERLVLLKKHERAMVKRLANTDPVQAAFSYIDAITDIPGNRSLYPVCLTMACLYFYQAMTSLPCTSAELYAYRSIIFSLSGAILLHGRDCLSIYVQLYVYKLLYTVSLRSSSLFLERADLTKKTSSSEERLIRSDPYEAVLEKLLADILQISKVNPFTHAPGTSMAHDIIHMKHVGNHFLAKYFESKKDRSTVYQYYYFEGVLKKWIDEKSFADERRKCMEDLLRDRHYSMADVEALLSWPLIPKTDDGWLLNTRHRLQFEHQAYAEVIGLTLNQETGEIELMFTQAKKNEHNLFDAADVLDVLTNSIHSSTLVLNPAEMHSQFHPLYQMSYHPPRLSKVPNYLFTLLHADYLLKMIATGVEISSRRPFEMRPAAENLLQRLPRHIREELQAILAKDAGEMTANNQQFWIEPEDFVQYEQANSKNFFGRRNEKITQIYLTSDLKMCVTHMLENDNDQSAAVQFARTLTKYYNEIGEYFPELLRLKELLKLGMLAKFISGVYKLECTVVAQAERNFNLRGCLTEMQQTLGPQLTNSGQPNEEILEMLSKTICEHYLCKKKDLRPYLINWMRSGQQQPLLQYAQQCVMQQKAKLKCTIEKFHLFADHADDTVNELVHGESSQCSWVPAALATNSDGIVYGGITLTAEVKQVTGIKQVQEKSKSIISVEVGKLFANVEKQRAKQTKSGAITNGQEQKQPSNEIKANLITYSKTRSEARQKALESSNLSADSKPLWTEVIDDRHVSIAGLAVREVYQHPDGYLICLQTDTARSHNSRQPQGSAVTTDNEKTHYKVFYENDSGREETNQRHYFDEDNDHSLTSMNHIHG